MRIATRKLLDGSFTNLGILSIALMSLCLLILVIPIFWKGMGAFFFRSTVEYRGLMLDKFGRGDLEAVAAERAEAVRARQPLYDAIGEFEKDMADGDPAKREKYSGSLQEFKDAVRALLGPLPGEPPAVLLRDVYGQTRWDRAQVKLHDALFRERYDYSDASKMGRKCDEPRVEEFRGTSLEPAFTILERDLSRMLLPRATVYWRFLFDESYDAHMFGGIWAEFIGTIYLAVGAMLFAIPMGVLTAVYLVEYAGDSRGVGLLRTCINTLAGVPSIVFGLFGLAFFINALHVSHSKSVLAGALTLALLTLPTVIRASEEALRAVPLTYKEAALSLGAGQWRTIVTVMLPAALPGILTGIIISLGRAAGETAPIIFTAAVSLGNPLQIWQTLSAPTPALPWNIYSLCSEHQAVDEIRHVQFGMVLTLVALVLLLNLAAVVLRARIASRLRG